MPLNYVTLPQGLLEPEARQAFVEAVTDAACRAESVPATPEGRRRSMVVLRDQPAGTVFLGGAPSESLIRSVFVDFYCSAGVLDAARKDRFAADLQAAAEALSHKGDPRPVYTSVIFHETPEGQWGREGAIRRLPEMAKAAGFEHLRTIAAP